MIKRLHKLVWDFRHEMKDYWATPEPIDALRYAFCEAGEAMDAWLRETRPGDSRNNEKNNDVLDELADCAIMLLTSMHNYPDDDDLDTVRNPTIDLIASRVSNCLWFHYDHRWRLYGLHEIAAYPGMDLEYRIKSRLASIAVRHSPGGPEIMKIIRMLDFFPDK